MKARMILDSFNLDASTERIVVKINDVFDYFAGERK